VEKEELLREINQRVKNSHKLCVHCPAKPLNAGSLELILLHNLG
jgi:hypothetical protein